MNQTEFYGYPFNSQTWFKRIKCMHYWRYEHMVKGWPDPQALYSCENCGKTIEQSQPPLNLLKPTRWEIFEREVKKGNGDMVMSPPMIPRDVDMQ
ncbi:hypothetical protein ACWDTP_30840 [Mycobacterium sp. NPDC003449]